MAVSKTIEVALGAQQADVQRRIASGDYEDASDVIRDALHALDDRDAFMEETLRADVKASMADNRPSVPIDEAFERARARIAQYAKANGRDT